MAVLKIDAPAESLFPVALAIPRTLKVGQRVFAIGNPFGLRADADRGDYFQLEPYDSCSRSDRRIRLDYSNRRGHNQVIPGAACWTAAAT